MKVLIEKYYATEIEVPDDCQDIESYIKENIWSPFESDEYCFMLTTPPWDDYKDNPGWEETYSGFEIL